MKTNAGVAVLVAFSCIVPFAVVTLPSARAQAPVPSKGLFAEASTKVDGATIRRIHDPENDINCYVATAAQATGYTHEGTHVAISCVHLYVVNP